MRRLSIKLGFRKSSNADTSTPHLKPGEEPPSNPDTPATSLPKPTATSTTSPPTRGTVASRWNPSKKPVDEEIAPPPVKDAGGKPPLVAAATATPSKDVGGKPPLAVPASPARLVALKSTADTNNAREAGSDGTMMEDDNQSTGSIKTKTSSTSWALGSKGLKSKPKVIQFNADDKKKTEVTYADDSEKTVFGTDASSLAKSDNRRSKYVSTGLSLFKLSEAESSFLPGELRRRLGASAGQLPPAPSVFVNHGAVLFVDISGFTKLGENLRKENVPVLAAKKLAKSITHVLAELTRICNEYNGDVAKFAGDALLCFWEEDSLDVSFDRAKACGIAMLQMMRQLNKQHDAVGLDLHGGLARGSIMHFHLGSNDDSERWYLVAGEAVAGATQLVDKAEPGEIACLDDVAKGRPQFTERTEEEKKLAKEALAAATAANSSSASGGGPADDDDDDAEEEVEDFRSLLAQRLEMDRKHISGMRPGLMKAVTSRNVMKVSTVSYITSVSDPPKLKQNPRRRASTTDDPVLRDGLPRSCNVYMPKMLRGANIESKIQKGGGMRNRVGVIFADLADIALSEEELLGRKVQDGKLDKLNEAFVDMTRITHAFGGEIRDMLFDDKGCVFIAVFGAHNEDEIQDSDAKALNAALAISHEVPQAKIGVSVGSCFVGMCGIDRRYDFVVIGHDVNMAARFMCKADPGQVVVSSGIFGANRERLQFTELEILIGKGNKKQKKVVFAPKKDIVTSAQFQAQYAFAMRDKSAFVGRSLELELIEQTLTKICFQSGRSGIILAFAGPGIGKSSLVTRSRRMGRGRIKVATSTCTSMTKYKPHYAFRALLEAYTGLRPGLTADEMSDVLRDYEGYSSKSGRIDESALATLLPWIGELARRANGLRHDKEEMTKERLIAVVLNVIDVARKKDLVDSSLLIFEDIHEMDTESLSLLSLLLDGLAGCPRVCVMMTSRHEPTPLPITSSVLSDATKAKHALQMAEFSAFISKAKKVKFNSLHLELQGLSKSDCAFLISRSLGCIGVTDAVLERLYQETKGIPIHLTQLLEWMKNKAFFRKQGGSDLLDWSDAGKESKFPSGGQRGVILARLDEMNEKTRRAVELASFGGEDFDCLYIVAASRHESTYSNKPSNVFTSESAFTACTDAMNTNFFNYVEDLKDRERDTQKWRWFHDDLRQVTLSSIPEEKRKKLGQLLEVETAKLLVRMNAGFFAEESEN